jgi:ATP adenylyltransferase
MERIWAPWRAELFEPKPTTKRRKGCVFCSILREPAKNDRRNLVLHRDERCFVILNRYPYTGGHLMVMPYEHTDDPWQLAGAGQELLGLAAKAMDALRVEMKCEGFNVGMNLGKVAGAGVPGHGHLHVVPRWNGDANFMAVVAERRIINEGLLASWKRLAPYFQAKR